MQLCCGDVPASSILLSLEVAVSNALIERRTTHAQNTRGLNDLETQMRKRFDGKGHRRLGLFG